jgi:hypothetical protein
MEEWRNSGEMYLKCKSPTIILEIKAGGWGVRVDTDRQTTPVEK